jgi:phosphatidylserine/phosphatidylglycerophosphate/cardiolipin synthase-like enzyme
MLLLPGIPDRAILHSLEDANRRGVKVRVLTPESSKLAQQVNSQSGNLSFNTGLGL